MNALHLHAGTLPHDIQLLQGLKPSEINSVLAAAKRQRYPAKSVIARQGESANHFFLLWKGRARHFLETPDGKKMILKWITPGQVFGAVAMVARTSHYYVSSETVQESVALVWDGSTIRQLARRFPQILENSLIIAADYFAWYVAAHSALISQSARERVAHHLAALAPVIGEKIPGGAIEIDVTNEELASSTNITPYTASRLLSQWQKSGILRKHRGKIRLHSPERLFLRVL
ncbi:MAG TPA: Crp/Fnr family transcriptional regulator [Verrucomicrobiae bacterium]|nr:Crp/Fnr family transcriptional regulator [Verrucomicrobiae bacterium]